MGRFKNILDALNIGVYSMVVVLLLARLLTNVDYSFQWFGKFHPLFVHLPIGMAFLAGMWLFAGRRVFDTHKELFGLSVQILAFFSGWSIITGLLISSGNDYDEAFLGPHRWSAIFFGFSTFVLTFLWTYKPMDFRGFILYFIFLLGLVVTTGHLGGTLTHGGDFLSWPNKKEVMAVTQFEAEILPVFKSKCSSCHNSRKRKGGLSLATTADALKGGKSGPLWIAGDTLNSLILERIHLPSSDEEHMPPVEKPQLSNKEKNLLSSWIFSGADTEILRSPAPQTSSHYEFKPAPPELLQNLQSPFYSLQPIAHNSPALALRFLLRSSFDMHLFDPILKVQNQVVSIHMNGMPAGNDLFGVLKNFENLEYLNLSGTLVTGDEIGELKECKRLKTLVLANTKIDYKNLKQIADHDALLNIYAWNTSINEEEQIKLEQEYSRVNFDWGVEEEANEILPLNAPVFNIRNDSLVEINHVLPNTLIKYTLDGSLPDSMNSPEYLTIIPLDGFSFIRAKAFKPGWKSSPEISRAFFISKLVPDSVVLANLPDPSYRGKGAPGLINRKEGLTSDFRDGEWMGFRLDPLHAEFSGFSSSPKGLTVSYLVNKDSYIVPPESIEVWGWEAKNSWIMLHREVLDIVSEKDRNGVAGWDYQLPDKAFEKIRIVIQPLGRLPAWHPGKNEKGWLFVDEIYFY